MTVSDVIYSSSSTPTPALPPPSLPKFRILITNPSNPTTQYQHNSLPNATLPNFFADANTPSSPSSSSSSSSSIGRNSSTCTSSLTSSPARASDDEAESCLHDPLEGMPSLRAFLPPRIGLSRFIGGKSRSFTCLDDAYSIQNLAKPENPYARRRSYKHSAEASGRQSLSPSNSTCRISKKSACNSKSNLPLALAMALKQNGEAAEKLKLRNNPSGILEISA